MAEDERSMDELLRESPAARRSEALMQRIFGTDPEPQQEPDNTIAPDTAHEEQTDDR